MKIADFGLSKLAKEITAESGAESTPCTTNCRWLAPEVLETGKWMPASDVYAFGVVMWEMLTWELPWSPIETDFLVSKLDMINLICIVLYPSEVYSPGCSYLTADSDGHPKRLRVACA